MEMFASTSATCLFANCGRNLYCFTRSVERNDVKCTTVHASLLLPRSVLESKPNLLACEVLAKNFMYVFASSTDPAMYRDCLEWQVYDRSNLYGSFRGQNVSIYETKGSKHAPPRLIPYRAYNRHDHRRCSPRRRSCRVPGGCCACRGA